MNNDNGKSYYGIGLDNSQLKNDATEASKILHGIDEEATRQSAAVRELLSNIPTVNIEFVTNAATTLGSIDAAFEEIDRVVETNKAAIRELEIEYDRLDKAASAAFMQGDNEAGKALQEQEIAVKKVIKVRKQVNKEAEATADKLLQEEKRLKEEAVAVEKTAQKHVSLRTRIREVKEQLIEMEAAGLRGTDAYRALQQEVGNLTKSWKSAQKQAAALGNAQRNMQGLISGLQGITGAASVAQGAVGLFGKENEHLQQIMLRVQSLMAITMGLQQVQQTLNKNSAFSLITLNGLKSMWNKILGKSAVSLEVENAAIATNTAENKANTAATVTDTAAQAANNTSTVTGTAAQVGNAAATKAATAATVAQTFATKVATMALRGFKAVLISTGIGALVVLVGELVAKLADLIDTTSKADKEFKEHEEILSKGREAYAKTSIEIEDYKIRLERFNGTKEEEKKLVKELNSKYGEAMGYYNSLARWKKVLIEKGEAYCQTLLKEAEAQAILSKYTEAYIHLQEVKDKAAKGEYDRAWYNPARWFGDSNEERRNKLIKEAEEEQNKWLKRYRKTMNEAQKIKDEFDLNPHAEPKKKKKKKKDKFDPEKAALEIQKALEEYKKARTKYVKEAEDEITNLIIESQEQGLTRELNEIRRSTRQKLEAWNEQLEKLAEVRKAAAKAQFINRKGATEVGWAKSDNGKKTIKDWINVIKTENPKIIKEFNRVWDKISENGSKAIKEAQQRYTDALIDEFGTDAQKEEKLVRVWTDKLKFLPPEFFDQAIKQMEQEFSRLGSDKFKAAINWESVFGDMSKQALPVLEFTLGKIREHFEKNKATMSTEEIKEYQQAIVNMENEIADRNPFVALHKSIKDIKAAKEELINANAAMKASQNELNAAIAERNAIIKEYNEILKRVENGEIVDGCDEQTEALGRLTDAKKRVTEATEKNNSAEQRYMAAQNRVVSSNRAFAENLSKVGAVITGVGGKAKELAAIFSDDVSDSIEKAIDFINDIIDATSSVIDALSDIGKSAAKGIETAVEASAQGTQAAANAGAAAMSTIEKASVILAIISAALQVATAIAKLFNSDNKRQKEIEKLQQRIDQLQWELNNKEAVRIRDTYGDALERLRKIYAETTEEILKMHISSEKYGSSWVRWLAKLKYKAEIYQKTVEKIADAYASMSYTADKALGSKKYDDSRKQLKNLAQQQILIQQQMDKESSKKKKDKGKIQDYKNKIAEIAAEMAAVINEMLEDIIGHTAADLASELGNAFFDAARQGEDAMEAWHKKVNEIVGDIVKRMLITQYLEPQIGKIFDKYKKKWFGEDGKFKGIENVIASTDQMAADIREAGNFFSQIYNTLSDSLKQYFDDTGSREASKKGIANASQESIDELNGRATAIQGHTYNICEYTKQIVMTTSLILQSIVNIESETKGFGARLERMEGNLKGVKDTVDDIALRGIKIQN